MDHLTVGEFLKKVNKVFTTVTVREDENLNDIIEKMIVNKVDRVVYVVDAENRIRGIISLGDLARHYFSQGVYQSKSLYPSAGIINLLTAEKAGDIMKTNYFSVRLSDGLDEIITKMIKYMLVKVIPVLDEEDRIVSSLDILDIIEYKIRGEGT